MLNARQIKLRKAMADYKKAFRMKYMGVAGMAWKRADMMTRHLSPALRASIFRTMSRALDA